MGTGWPGRSAAARSAIGPALLYSVGLATSCLISYVLIWYVLAAVHSLSMVGDSLSGMWSVVATILVYRTGFRESVAAALSRTRATLRSFALCLVYLLVLPFSPLGLAVLIGLGTLTLMLTGRPADVVTYGITTAVVMVVAARSPVHAREQPILRLADTAVGVAVGCAFAWIALRLCRWDAAWHRRMANGRFAVQRRKAR
jgi:uncharacterized membrane protein YccC